MTSVLQALSDRYYIRGLPRLLFASRKRSLEPFEVRDPDGVRTLCAPNNYFQQQIKWGNYEHTVRKLIREILRPDDTFVDVGCNIGYLSCVGADCVGRGGKVIGVDPNPEVIELTNLNASLNGFDWIETYCTAAGAETSVARLSIGTEHSLSTLRSGAKGIDVASTINVPVQRMDELLADIDRVRLVKIDTEGYESEVLSGLTRNIHAKKSFYIFEHVGANFDDPVATLTRNLKHFEDGYSLFWMDSMTPGKFVAKKKVLRTAITNANLTRIAPLSGNVLVAPNVG